MMKKITTKLMVAVAILFFGFNQVKAQDDLDKLLEAGLSDANLLIEGYVEPFMKGFGTSLGSGWYNTAKAHKSGGFDLTVTVNAAYVPDKDLLYDLNALNLSSNFSYDKDQAPTIFGTNDAQQLPTYTVTDPNTNESVSFDAPEGLNLKDEIGMQAVPVPMAQLGIGIIKNTDIKIRWTPEIEIDDNGTFKLIGFGIMHDVKQHIPGIKNLPFDLSAFVGYTSVSTDVAFDEEVNAGSGGVSTTNGLGVFDVNTLTVQGIISKKFSVLTLYGGLGFNRVRSELKLKGDYVVTDDFGVVDEVYTDPIDLSFKTGGPRLTAGMRLKLAIFTLHADYTVQKYDVLTVGFGFSVR
ncbi:hypothetical protein LVD17_03985 [Fulvivirga ulvae]|uniref:DUF6588 family protein n=1 Tax=Fulvivirga ulvae TaxID=2904245 RepID=UPI001F2C22FC|nr:DUF6588 family protein [Fulvivirga ulvae]UII32987.1 hypothetical protein LVD17_03985 [Fulvivirga ulvae]